MLSNLLVHVLKLELNSMTLVIYFLTVPGAHAVPKLKGFTLKANQPEFFFPLYWREGEKKGRLLTPQRLIIIYIIYYINYILLLYIM